MALLKDPCGRAACGARDSRELVTWIVGRTPDPLSDFGAWRWTPAYPFFNGTLKLKPAAAIGERI